MCAHRLAAAHIRLPLLYHLVRKAQNSWKNAYKDPFVTEIVNWTCFTYLMLTVSSPVTSLPYCFLAVLKKKTAEGPTQMPVVVLAIKSTFTHIKKILPQNHWEDCCRIKVYFYNYSCIHSCCRRWENTGESQSAGTESVWRTTDKTLSVQNSYWAI